MYKRSHYVSNRVTLSFGSERFSKRNQGRGTDEHVQNCELYKLLHTYTHVVDKNRPAQEDDVPIYHVHFPTALENRRSGKQQPKRKAPLMSLKQL